MNSEPVLIETRINRGHRAHALVDCGCDCYAVIDEALVKRLRIPLVDSKPRRIGGFSDATKGVMSPGVAVFVIETGGYDERIFAYVIPGLGQDVFLGRPWMEKNQVVYDAAEQQVYHGIADVAIRLLGQEEPEGIRAIRAARLVPAAVFAAECRRLKKCRDNGAGSVRAISLSDIEKALRPKQPFDPSKTVPRKVLEEFGRLFSPEEAMKLPPHRPGVDHEVNLQRDSSGKEPALPWGPLYNMSREELMVLRKTLTDLLDNGFIRASSSAAAAPVLFVRKPNGGLRFCCDYRALNAITKRDRYPLPLIAETLQNLAKAKWFTKLDVVAAFHKIRMAPGHEEKTAFRTRFGLYEWLVCPFGLSSAPASFQRYMNSVLRKYLDDFVTAYLDDVLIYSDGSRADHEAKVRLVLRSLADAGLHLDPAKCEFSVQKVKYLGFIVQAGKGIACDPEKQRAIREWEAPTNVKGVRSFLGFANYYRIFIPDYAHITKALDALLKKGAYFRWGRIEEEAFQELKLRFCEAPILRQWDPSLRTFAETDCSGYALGGVLSQEGPDGRRHAVAFYSRRLSPAEYNYPIHDKEMLAIIRCLDAWSAELKSCGTFTILTDHRNLEYFMTRQKLTERQSRWAAALSQFDFKLDYRPGCEAVAPDALSRREQDIPKDMTDEREQGRVAQMIPGSAIPEATRLRINRIGMEAPTPPETKVFEASDLHELWNKTIKEDLVYRAAYQAVQRRDRSFPPALGLKVQISECEIDVGKRLVFRDRIWVPGGSGEKGNQEEADKDTLRTRIVQDSHDSAAAGHPGREGTLAIVARRFFWPGQSQLVRRFVANCDTCGRGHIWRQSKRGFLKPLPIPDRPHSHLAMDFITDLPPTGPSKARYLWVIIDRLTKAVTLEVMDTMEAEACAARFLQCHYRFHGMPRSIVSDRGSNWLSRFWKRFCELARISQRLSTAYHPQTDGGPERMNQEIQAYLRAYVSYLQKDWGDFLPAAQLALNNRESAAMKISPFFVEHGYHVEPLSVDDPVEPARDPAEGKADALLSRLQEVTEYMQAMIAASQQRQEETTNSKRQPAERFEVGDKVWLSMANYRSPRPCKKLDWLHHKYTVTKVISSHVVELDVPGSIHARFHVDLLRRARQDPAPGQQVDDAQPPPIRDETGTDLWEVDEILCARWKKRGRGEFRQALVHWTGYAEPTWEPVEAMQETDAMKAFEARYGPIRTNDGPREKYETHIEPRQPRRRRLSRRGEGR
jgi:transposase InsO family protein